MHFYVMRQLCLLLGRARYAYLFQTSFFMKLSGLTLGLMFASICCLQARHVHSQSLAETKVTLRLEGATLKAAFTAIESQSVFRFMYNSDQINGQLPVTYTANQKTLQLVLNDILGRNKYRYQLKDNFILVTADAAPGSRTTEPVSTVQQLVTITGKVKDENEQPVPGVTVLLKGSTTATITDEKGTYTLRVPDAKGTLVFSMIGFTTQEIPVDNKLVIDVQLKGASSSLNEVIVVGMNNKQSKRSVTGAIATIQTKELKQSPVANLSNALAGRLPGLITVQTTGEPGQDAASLYIRGIGTYGNSSPLVVIDGLPRSAANFSQLDANEIESVTILKDASSSALYGIQGANGVIVVTTRRGNANQKPSISFTVQQAVQQPIRLPKMMETYDQALYYNEFDANSNLQPRFSPEALEVIKEGSNPYAYPNVNWFKTILKDYSSQSQYNLNISGGSNAIRYFVSGSFINQGTLLQHQDQFFDNYGVKSKFGRYNFRSNVDMDVTSMLKVQVDLAGRLEERTGPGPGFSYIFEDIAGRSQMAQPVFNPDGTLGAGSATELPYRQNPYGMITKSGYYSNYTNVMYGTLSARHTLDFITPGLSAQLFFSFENNNNRSTSRSQNFDSYWYRGLDEDGDPIYQPHTVASRLSTSGSSNIERYNYLDFRINYTRNWGKSAVTAQVLGNRTLRAINDELPFAYQGVSGRATYAYNQRYFAEVNIGYNGSENFAKGRRYGIFPAFSAGWVLSEENFLKGTDWLKYLKLRGSHGIAGNDKSFTNARWVFITDYAPGGGYQFGVSPSGVGGYNENKVGNMYVTWERAAKSNIGIDVSLFRNEAIQFTFDIFRERRTNILTSPGDVPGFVAITNMAPRNSGVVNNQGFETELRFNKLIGKVRVFTNVQLTYARNKVLENDQPRPAFPYQDLKGYEVGYQLGYKALGLFQSEDEIKNSAKQNFSSKLIPGDVKYLDVNNDGVINAFDRVPIQIQNIPRYMGGLSLGASYKGLDISMLLNGALGGTSSFWHYSGSLLQLQRWTPENTNTRIPVAHRSDNNGILSDLLVQKTDYLKLRNAEIGYEFPAKILAPVRVKYLRIYVNGQNLAVWDKLLLKDRDPETAASLTYPLQRIMNVGASLRF